MIHEKTKPHSPTNKYKGFTFEKNRQATNRSPKYAKLIEASDLLVAPPFPNRILSLVLFGADFCAMK